MKPGATTQPSASSSRSPCRSGADLGDAAVADRDVGAARRGAGAVDDGAAPDDDVGAHRAASLAAEPASPAFSARARALVAGLHAPHQVAQLRDRRAGAGAAVDRHHDPGDLRRPVADEVEHRFGDVGRPAVALQRLHGPDHRAEVVVGDAGGDVPGGDAVHPDAVRREVDRGRLAELHDRGLRRPVDDRPRAAGDGGDRRGVDDRAAALLAPCAAPRAACRASRP